MLLLLGAARGPGIVDALGAISSAVAFPSQVTGDMNPVHHRAPAGPWHSATPRQNSPDDW